jgi:single-strand DNA-binding protein
VSNKQDKKQDGAYIYITGRVGQDPELRHTPNGKRVASFSVEVPEGKERQKRWYQVAAWEEGADAVMADIVKGMRVTVGGWLSHDEWEKDGVKRWAPKVNARSVMSEDVPREERAPLRSVARGEKPKAAEQPAAFVDDDSIPF